MEDKNFTIRFAQKDDSGLIFKFIQLIAEYERLSDEIECDEEQIRRTVFDQEQAQVLIGEEGGIPVGFALFFHNYSTFKGNRGLYLEDLFVNPKMRGKGYGKALFIELVRIARERGCSRMEWCCLNWNIPSINFYKSLGAVPMDDWMTYRLDKEQLFKMKLV